MSSSASPACSRSWCDPSPRRRPLVTRPFAGWVVVSAVFVQLMTSSGLAFYGLAIYLDALTDEQAFSTTSVSLATSMFFVVSGVVGQLVARLLERHDVRLIVAAGGVVSSISLYLLGAVTSVTQLYAVYVLFAIGFALVGLIPATTLVTRWFQVRRATALSVASTGLSVGAFTLSAPASALIDDRGLADAAPVLALVYLVLTALVVPWLWPSPAQRGLYPDGRAPLPAATPIAEGIPYGQAIRTRFFAVLAAAFVLAMGAQVGGLSQIANLGSERVDRAAGAAAITALALGSVIGRLVGGVLADRLPLIRLAAVLSIGQGLALVGIGFADTRTNLIVIAFVFGTTVGNLLMLQPLITAAGFGVLAYPRIFALLSLIVTAGVAGGPFLLGFLRDQSSYQTSYLVAGALSFGAAAVFTATGVPRPTPETVAGQR